MHAVVRICGSAVTTVTARAIVAPRRLHQCFAAPASWLHTSASSGSAKNPGPVESKLRKEVNDFSPPATLDTATLAPAKPGEKVYSAKIRQLADALANMTLLESMDLTDALQDKLGLSRAELLFPGGSAGGGAAAPAAAAPAAAAAAPAAAAPKAESTHVDIKLKAFDQKNKIKVIKEVRGVTSLGLKEAKDLVEGSPCVILQKVKREDAVKMIEKLKADTGAEFELV